MKIWLNNLSLGDSFWYHNFKKVKYGTIIDRVSDSNYRMERWRLDTGDEMFVNQFGYTTPEEAANALLIYCNTEITNKNAQIALLNSEIQNLNEICEYLIKYLNGIPKGNA